MRPHQTELHKSRPLPAEEPTTGLSTEDKEKQREKASCIMFIKFKDGNKRSFWSNEWKKPYKYKHIGEAINEQMRLFEKYFRKHTASAAIFDTRTNKNIEKENKIYQFENGVWNLVKSVSW
jgi:hypothetical protein